MARNNERSSRIAKLSLIVALGVGGAACSGDGEPVTQETPTGQATTYAGPTAMALVVPKPQDVMQLNPNPKAWSPRNPQPWGLNHELQIDSRNTEPVGAPVGAYLQPRQDEGPADYKVYDGQEYPATCYKDERHGAQWIRNDVPEGSYVWYGIDLDRNGTEDAYVPAANAGFTGIQPDGAADLSLPVCRS